MTKFAVYHLRDVSFAARVLDQKYFARSNDPPFSVASRDFHRRVEIDYVLPARGRMPVVIVAAVRRPKDNVSRVCFGQPMIIVKRGSFPQLDLSLISMDPGKIPDSLRERDMPLCREQPPTGAPVILAAPQGITRTSIASPTLIDPEYRTKYSTLISDGSTDGKSGSGVFDAEGKCLLGILSSKFANVVDHKGIASYFVPASTIQSFIPDGIRW